MFVNVCVVRLTFEQEYQHVYNESTDSPAAYLGAA